MAFSFGGASNGASTPSFSFAAATSAAASSSAFSFGGAAAPPAPFGAASTPAFGQHQIGASLFGGTPAPAFGTAASTAASAGAFGASSASLFASSTAPSLFGAPAGQSGALTTFAAPAFGAQSQGGGAFGSAFGGSSFGGAPQQQQQQYQQQIAAALCGNEGKPLMHSTKWEDISPQGQNYLVELEKIISQHREECRQLDENSRLWGDDGSNLKQEMAADEQALRQALAGLEAALKGDLQTVAVFREKAVALLHDTEHVVRTFQRTHRWRAAGKVLPGQVLPPGIRDQLNGPIILPSMYLRRATKSFQEALEQYQLLVVQLEALLPQHSGGSQAQQDGAPSAVAALPVVLHNLHDFFNHVAARLEALHDGVDAAREAFLERRRKAGDMTDPFAEAERRAQLRQKAAQAKLFVIPPSQGVPMGQPGSAPAAASAPAASPGGAGLLGGGTTSSLFGASIPAASPASAFGSAGGLFGASPAPAAATTAWATPAASTPSSTVSGSRRGRSRK